MVTEDKPITYEWEGRTVLCADEYERTVWQILRRVTELDRCMETLPARIDALERAQLYRRLDDICRLGVELGPVRPRESEIAVILFARDVVFAVGRVLGLVEIPFPAPDA